MTRSSRQKAPRRMTATPTKNPKPSPTEISSELPRWTFLTNHAHVLILLYRDPDIVLREVALRVGITERAVQRIIHDLEEGGFIEREKVGRRNRYRVLKNHSLRHPIEAHCSIGELLQLLIENATSS